MSDEDKLAAAVPKHVRAICERLAGAGFAAVAVGGAVRDALRGSTPHDWDVATSAHPEQVLALFRGANPVGGHLGTVKERDVEITPFRSEGTYSDSRRPDSVTFGVSLDEDLLRRDFTVNAIAFDPIAKTIHDPFDGRGDLARGLLRAVGDPVARFTEDVLRVLRAVRFVAQLELDLDPATEAAIAPAVAALPTLPGERISVELRKLLATARPSRGLAIAVRTGIVHTIIPQLATLDLAAIDRGTVDTRLALALRPIGDARRIEELLRELKFSNDEAALARVLAAIAPIDDDPAPHRARALLAAVPRASRAHVEPYLRALGNVLSADAVRAVARDPLDISDLAVTGNDLMRELALSPGPKIGDILRALHADVLADPERNTRDYLLARARELAR